MAYFERSASVPNNSTGKQPLLPHGAYSQSDVDDLKLEEKSEKLMAFQEYLNSINTIPDDEYFASQISVEGAVEYKVKVLLYFIGRLNPPHPGHIDVLIELIEHAIKNNTKALILLGNGPKDKEISENPLSFDKKKAFITYKLAAMEKYNDGKFFEIVEKTNPVANVTAYVRESLSYQEPDNISILHVAGGKDDDASKLDFIKKFAIKAAEQSTGMQGNATASSMAIDPTSAGGVAFSATKVRTTAYELNHSNPDSAFAEWSATRWDPTDPSFTYGMFYGEHSLPIFNEIIENGYVDYYIKPPKRARKGGTKTKKNKRKTRSKTQRRKRRSLKPNKIR